MADKHAWEVQARTRIDWLRSEVREAARRMNGAIEGTGYTGPQAEMVGEAFAEIMRNLAKADALLDESSRPVKWLRGTKVEGVWSCIHSAHARMIEVASLDQVDALVTDVRSAAGAYLAEKDPWRKKIDEWKRRTDFGYGDRELLSFGLRRAYDGNAERYTQLRRYRNIMFGAALLFGVLAGALAGLGAAEPDALPLCFTPTAAKAQQVCPSGEDKPKARDDAIGVGLGMMGGALGGVRSLTRSSRATVSSYTLRVARMALKMGVGALAPVAGLLFLKAGFAPGFDGLDSQAQILGYAILFGMSQQLLTRIADQHAEAVLKSASSETESTDTPPD